MNYCVDSITRRGADGWAIAPSGTPVLIEALLDGIVIGRAVTDAHRADVAAAFPGMPGADRAGFALDFDPDARFPDGPAKVEIIARDGDRAVSIGGGTVMSGASLARGLAAAADDGMSAFPRGLAAAASALFPDAVSPIAAMVAQREARSLPIVSDYLRFLGACQAHFAFVERCFPITNARACAGAKDYFCRQSSAREMLAIAHHLYVLRSFGVIGAFAEFGCFKGFSTSMLSYACALLGIDMHVYDSFAGLPPSSSIYYVTGEFAGGLNEVQANVAQFGSPQAVTFHKGFFADSLKREQVPALMLLWMDVDLESSALDLASAFARLHPRGAVFSHECDAPDFVDDAPIIRARGPDSVVPVIIDTLGGVLAGRHIGGHTGAFWWRNDAVPVADVDAVLAILAAAASDAA